MPEIDPQWPPARRENDCPTVLVLSYACVPRHAWRFAFQLIEQRGLAAATHYALLRCAEMETEGDEESRRVWNFTLAALAEAQRTTRAADEALH